MKKIFASVPFIVDVDDSIGSHSRACGISIDQDRLEFFGVEQSDVYDTIQALFGGIPVGYSHRGEGRNPIEIAVRPAEARSDLERVPRVDACPGQRLPGKKPLSNSARSCASRRGRFPTIFRRDGRFADMVMAELAGAYEAPIYGMLEVDNASHAHDWGNSATARDRACTASRDDESNATVLWDGEWEITYVTFRDMGAAFAVAMIGIYILVVAQFGSFKLPLVILTPIPLTLIGIMLGHWLFGAPFTATSMIGFIALAGIIVRNSILLVDFIRHGAGGGQDAARECCWKRARSASSRSC